MHLETRMPVHEASCAPASPKGGLLAIPDVRGFVEAPSSCAVERNHIITGGYQQFAALVQEVVDPAFRHNGVSHVAPNWFAMGSYVSNTGGKNMVALAQARALLAARASSAEVSSALQFGAVGKRALGLLLPVLARAEPTSAVSRTLCALWLMLSRQVSPAPRMDARVLPRLVRRTMDLLESAPGRDLAGKVDAIMRTGYNALADGNLAIYSDLGGAGQDFFELRNVWGPFEDEEPLFQVLSVRWAPDHEPRFVEDARRVLSYCLARLGDFGALCALTSCFSHIGPERGLAFVAAGFALYERARRTTSLRQKNLLVAASNALLALREQRDVVQRAFEGRGFDEVDRADVFRLVTPFLTITVGPASWQLSCWAETSAERGSSPGLALERLESPASRHNWAIFEERWMPILDFFEYMYTKPELVWTHRFNPDPRR